MYALVKHEERCKSVGHAMLVMHVVSGVSILVNKLYEQIDLCQSAVIFYFDNLHKTKTTCLCNIVTTFI